MHAPHVLVITVEYDRLRDARARRQEIGVAGSRARRWIDPHCNGGVGEHIGWQGHQMG
jgi:hypothetical protein